MSKIIFLFFTLITATIYSQPKQGMWRGALSIQKEKALEIPFNFEIKTVNGAVQLIIYNAEERLVVNEIVLTKDSFNFKMPVFDTEFRTKLINSTSLTGVWINHTKKENNTMPFNAKFGNEPRFTVPAEKPHAFFDGKWEACFSPNTPDSSKAIGLFKHKTGTTIVHGTFRTETGDYRYLEGTENNNKLYLSCFDGSHAFLFTAENNGTEIINGRFYSGSTWSEHWIGRRNEAFELRDAEKLTYLKDPNQVIDLSFQNSSGQTVSLSDAKFKNKVVIVQIMGSWCPNCMDETAYLATLYKKYSNQNFEVIGLAYERTSDPEKAKNNIARLKNRFGVTYEVLMTGLTGKDKASQSLPFLNGIMAFPTTLILDKNHKAVSVYTGFNGPATGKAYEDYVEKTEKLIEKLIK
jgi:thiol-disulfide isomerase/thioredoxin